MTEKVVVIFGAGSGLGLAAAKRFGSEGYRVALVARRPDRLSDMVRELATQGVDATAFPADLSQSSDVPNLIAKIRDTLGRIDAITYGPVGGDIGFGLPSQIDISAQADLAHVYTFSFIAAVQAVLPEMLERDGGIILLSEGYSAAHPIPGVSGPGIMMAATRNYLHSLAGELANTGVYAGVLTIGAVILGSEAAAGSTAEDDFGDFNGVKIIAASADDIAKEFWDMTQKRDAIERYFPADLTPAS